MQSVIKLPAFAGNFARVSFTEYDDYLHLKKLIFLLLMFSNGWWSSETFVIKKLEMATAILYCLFFSRWFYKNARQLR